MSASEGARQLVRTTGCTRKRKRQQPYSMLTLNPPLSFTPDEDEAPPILGTGFELRLQSHTKNWLAKLRQRCAHEVSDGVGAEHRWRLHFHFALHRTPGTGTSAISSTKPSVESIVRFIYDPLPRGLASLRCRRRCGRTNGDVVHEFVLDMRGDWEEHALLLLNYLIWFDKRSSSSFAHYLVLAVPFQRANHAMCCA